MNGGSPMKEIALFAGKLFLSAKKTARLIQETIPILCLCLDLLFWSALCCLIIVLSCIFLYGLVVAIMR